MFEKFSILTIHWPLGVTEIVRERSTKKAIEYLIQIIKYARQSKKPNFRLDSIPPTNHYNSG